MKATFKLLLSFSEEGKRMYTDGNLLSHSSNFATSNFFFKNCICCI